jgi:phosphoglycolate phosphatase-like HAD superfamily hydrolase
MDGKRSVEEKMNENLKNKTIIFDFDGTLIRGGQDKGIHLMDASWVACYQAGFRKFLHPDALDEDIDHLLRAYLKYPGAPRFQQFTAFLNSLINNNPTAVDDPAKLKISQELLSCYEHVRNTYNTIYSSLNDAAAEKYWRPFPSVNDALSSLANEYDLYIASGLPQNLLEQDFIHYNFDHSLFLGIFGSDKKGGSNKGEILKRIKAKGYRETLFVGDSTKDLEYAVVANVKFFRIKDDSDYHRLLNILPKGMPDENQPWTFTREEIEFLRMTTKHLLEAYCSGKPLSPEKITDFINKHDS